MTMGSVTYKNGRIFDGRRLIDDCAARFVGGVLSAVWSADDVPDSDQVIDLAGDILSPGFIDLQVNGGGGLMFNAAPTVATLERMAKAHRGLGVTQLLPTLITDTREITQAAIAAAIEAVKQGVPGIAGLHLEGPHLSITRKGAHDASLIRAMESADLDALLAAASELPVLKVTIAPENVTEDQVRRLTEAGVLVSLGHTDADYDTCLRYFAAGARCVTHLFNAMSQIGNRAPGLAGATLSSGRVSAGLIADAIHVHPEVLRLAWQSKRAPGQLFLVSDAMAVAGTAETSFSLNDREILRQDGKLRLADGTLAGADLDIATAISVLVNKVDVDLADALAAATRVPGEVSGLPNAELRVGHSAIHDVIRIASELSHATPLITDLVAPEI